ncbi:MAG: hypothetical protein LBO72_06065 [Helicobacteraceae bacterium]|jgi:hypothetical protein|nr:hypothetical protein [Helicobacteraceae bacterium]
MQISDVSAQNALERQNEQTETKKTQKSEKASEKNAETNRARRESDAESKAFAANAAKLSASEFYAQAKLFFSQSVAPATIAEASAAQATHAVQTAEKLASLVFDAAEDDEGLLKSAKSGFFDGFEKARQNWGGALPQIVNQTLDRAVEAIDLRLHSLGFPLLSVIA